MTDVVTPGAAGFVPAAPGGVCAHRAARRAAGRHRDGGGRAVGRRSGSGSASARATRRRSRPAPRTTSNTCCSRARGGARRRRSPRSSTRSAASSTRSPRRSTPATTRTCSTPTCRSRWRCSPTSSPTRRCTRRDVEIERSVVLEEIAMRDDDPEDLLGELSDEALFGDHPLGPPGDRLGGVGARRCAATTLHAFWRGAVHDAADGRRRRGQPAPRRRSSSWSATALAAGGGAGERRARLPARGVPRPAPLARGRRGSCCARTTPSRRTCCSACPGCRGTTRGARALSVLNTALGGGPSSRLFQQVREQRGLAYSVYSSSVSLRRRRRLQRVRRVRAGAAGARSSTVDPRRARRGRGATG